MTFPEIDITFDEKDCEGHREVEIRIPRLETLLDAPVDDYKDIQAVKEEIKQLMRRVNEGCATCPLGNNQVIAQGWGIQASCENFNFPSNTKLWFLLKTPGVRRAILHIEPRDLKNEPTDSSALACGVDPISLYGTRVSEAPKV